MFPTSFTLCILFSSADRNTNDAEVIKRKLRSEFTSFSERDGTAKTELFINTVKRAMRAHLDASKMGDLRLSEADIVPSDKSTAELFVCVVCLNIIEPESSTSCSHCDEVFDQTCLDECLKSKKQCPKCRKSIQ